MPETLLQALEYAFDDPLKKRGMALHKERRSPVAPLQAEVAPHQEVWVKSGVAQTLAVVK